MRFRNSPEIFHKAYSKNQRNRNYHKHEHLYICGQKRNVNHLNCYVIEYYMGLHYRLLWVWEKQNFQHFRSYEIFEFLYKKI